MFFLVLKRMEEIRFKNSKVFFGKLLDCGLGIISRMLSVLGVGDNGLWY